MAQVPMRLPNQRQERRPAQRQNPRPGNSQGGLPNQPIPGYGGGRPMMRGGPAVDPMPGPPMRVPPGRPPRVELGGAAELPEPEWSFGDLPPGQAKKSGLPFGWHYGAKGEPMRNVGGQTPRFSPRQPSRGGRVRTSRGQKKRRGGAGFGGAAAY